MPDFIAATFIVPFIDSAIQWLEKSIGLPPYVQQNILKSVTIVFLLWLIRLTVLKVVNKRTHDVRTRYQWQKSSAYVSVGIALLVIGRIWFEGFDALTTYLGLVSAGIAIALKDVLTSFVGWIFLLWRRPFEVGDRIQIGNHAGDVIDIRIFQFTLNEIGNWVDADQSTGRVIHIPNGLVFSAPLVNYTRGFRYIWDEIPVLVTFESDWKKAKSILLQIVDQHTEVLTEQAEHGVLEASKKFMIFYSTLSPTVYTSVKDSGVNLTLRYLVEPRKRRSRQEVLWEEILTAFAAETDIDLAYPTIRYYRGSENSPADHTPSGE
ncbi:MAG: mechanosensitive ion channel family protein [Bacteroidetes bacterium]|nr:mechanosensitive ion channel family protein [Bacteroidota bacterium]